MVKPAPLKELFQIIAKEESGELSVEYGASFSKLITFSPLLDDEQTGKKVTALLLRLNYRNQSIDILNELGRTFSGEVKCKLSEGLKLPDFKISARSHYLQLVSKRLDMLKVKCEEKEFSEFVQENLQELGLEDVAKKSQFEPLIKGVMHQHYEIVTNYSTAFAKKKEVVRPLIAFYKILVDYSLDNNNA